MSLKEKGFTLLELLIAVVIVAILVAAAAPSFQSMIEKNSVSTSLSDFSASLRLARAEAIRRGRFVVVCPSADQATCGGGGVTWANGWLVFVDEDGDEIVDAGDDEIVRIYAGLKSDNTLLWSDRGAAAWSGDSTTNVQYNSRGVITTEEGTFKVCSRSSNDLYARGLVISIMGSLRHTIDSNNNGIYEDESGGALSCS